MARLDLNDARGAARNRRRLRRLRAEEIGTARKPDESRGGRYGTRKQGGGHPQGALQPAPLTGAGVDHREGEEETKAPDALDAAVPGATAHGPSSRQAGISPPAPGVVVDVGSGESAPIRTTTERSTQ